MNQSKDTYRQKIPLSVYIFILIILCVIGAIIIDKVRSSTTPVITPSGSMVPTSPNIVGTATYTPTPQLATISFESAPKLSKVASFGKGMAQDVAWSPDGKVLAVATSLGIDLYYASSFIQFSFLQTNQSILHIRYSQNGKLLAAGGVNGQLQVWDVTKRKLVYTLPGGQSRVQALAFSTDGSTLFVGQENDGTIRQWDLTNGTLLAEFPGYVDGVQYLEISPNGKYLLAASSGAIRMRDITSKELLYPAIETGVEDLFFSLDGTRFITVNSAPTAAEELEYQIYIRYWDTASGTLLDEYTGLKDIVYGVAVSPDLRWIATAGLDGISIFDTTTNTKIMALNKHALSIRSLAFSPDGTKLVSIGWAYGGGIGSLDIWDFTLKEHVKIVGEYSGYLLDAVLSADEKLTAVVSTDHKVQVRDTLSGDLVREFVGNLPLAFSPDGKIIAFATGREKDLLSGENYNDDIELWDLESGKLLKNGVISCSGAVGLDFSKDGRTLAYGGESYRVTLRDIQSGKTIRTLDKAQFSDFMKYDTESLSFSPDGSLLAVLGHYRVEFWDVATGTLLNQIEGLASESHLAFSPDQKYLAISGFGGIGAPESVKIFDLSSTQSLISIATGFTKISSLVYSPDAQVLFVGGSDNPFETTTKVEVWDAQTGNFISWIPIPASNIAGLGISADGYTLMVAGNYGMVQLWRSIASSEQVMSPGITNTARPTLTPRATLTRQPTLTSTPKPLHIQVDQITILGNGSISPVLRSPDGKIISVIQDDDLYWYDAKTLAEIGTLPLDNNWSFDLASFSPNSKYLVVNGYLSATIIDLGEKKELGWVNGGNGGTTGFTWTRDSRYMAFLAQGRTSGGPYENISLFDTVTGQELDDDRFQTLLPERYHVMSDPAISPDDKLVAAGHSDKRVYVWDLESGETRFMLEGHADQVTSVDFSPDGRYLASGSYDGTVRLWNPASGALLRVITGLIDDVTGVKFSANGQQLIITMYDQPTQVFNISTGQFTPLAIVKTTPDPFAVSMHRQGYVEGGWDPSVLFSPDGSSLAVASGTILVWNTQTHELINSLEAQIDRPLVGMVYSPDSSRLAAINDQGDIQAWDVKSAKQILTLTSATLSAGQAIYGLGAGVEGEQRLAFSSDGNRLVFGNGAAIQVWDIQSGSKVQTLEQNQPPAYASRVSYSADGKRLYAVLNHNQRAAVWDAFTGKILHEVTFPDVDPNAFSVIALNGPLFARNNFDDQGYWIELWNLDTQQKIRLDTPGREVQPLRFSPDGSLLAAIYDYRVYYWKTSTGQLLYVSDEIEGDRLAISPDNHLLAVGNSGKADLWNIENIAKLASQPDLSPAVMPPTAIPMYGDSDPSIPTPYPTVVITPLPTPVLPVGAISAVNAARVVEKFHFNDGTIEQIAWSPNGDAFVTAGSMGVYRYTIQYSTGVISETSRFEPGSWIYGFSTLANRQTLATGVIDGAVKVWNIDSGEVLTNIIGGGEPILSPDGKQLVYLGTDGNLQVWDLVNQRLQAVLQSYSAYSRRPFFSPNGNLIAAVQSNGSGRAYNDAVRIWNARTGTIANALGGPDNDITDLNFSADGRYLVGAAGGSAWIWDVQPGIKPYTLTLYSGQIDGNLNLYEHKVTAAALSPDNRIVAVGTSLNTIWLYDRASRTVLQKLEGHTSPIRHLRFSPNGKYILSVDEDGSIILWEVSSGRRLSALYQHTGPIDGLVIRTDGNLAAWEGGTAWTIRPQNGELLATTRIYSGTILAASPVGDLLAVNIPYRMSLWDARTGVYRQTLEGEAEDVSGIHYRYEGYVLRGFYAASFSPDGQTLTTRAAGGVWEYAVQNDGLFQMSNYTQKAAEEVAWEKDEITATSPNRLWIGRITISWSDPAQFQLLDASTTEVIFSIPFSTDIPLVNLTFNPDSSLAAISQADGKIFLIDLVHFKVVATLVGHHGSVEHLVFSPDGRYLVSGGVDGTIRFWGLP